MHFLLIDKKYFKDELSFRRELRRDWSTKGAQNP